MFGKGPLLWKHSFMARDPFASATNLAHSLAASLAGDAADGVAAADSAPVDAACVAALLRTESWRVGLRQAQFTHASAVLEMLSKRE